MFTLQETESVRPTPEQGSGLNQRIQEPLLVPIYPWSALVRSSDHTQEWWESADCRSFTDECGDSLIRINARRRDRGRRFLIFGGCQGWRRGGRNAYIKCLGHVAVPRTLSQGTVVVKRDRKIWEGTDGPWKRPMGWSHPRSATVAECSGYIQLTPGSTSRRELQSAHRSPITGIGTGTCRD